jgi:hypothetical protein
VTPALELARARVSSGYSTASNVTMTTPSSGKKEKKSKVWGGYVCF